MSCGSQKASFAAPYLWRADTQSGLTIPIRRMQCDHKPIIQRMRLDLQCVITNGSDIRRTPRSLPYWKLHDQQVDADCSGNRVWCDIRGCGLDLPEFADGGSAASGVKSHETLVPRQSAIGEINLASLSRTTPSNDSSARGLPAGDCRTASIPG